MQHFDWIKLVDVVGNIADVNSGVVKTPPWATGLLLSWERISGAPGTAAGVVLNLQYELDQTFRNWVSLASFDANAVSYKGWAVLPHSGILIGAFSAVAPVMATDVTLAPLPREFRLNVDRATAQSMDFRAYAHWLKG